jgi:hypothetical protein
MLPLLRVLDGTPSAAMLLVLGYSVGSLSLDQWQRLVHEIIIPLYVCGVVGYIVLRIYHVAIEPRLAPSSAKKEPPSQVPSIDELEAEKAPMPVDMTGTFKLVENNNFEELLAAQGVPWLLLGPANRARPTHKITHKGNLVTIKIEGIIESQTKYEIKGPPTESAVRGRAFRDQMTYLEDGTGIQTLKRAVNDGYTVTVRRRLAPDRSKLTMTSTVTFDDESKETVDCMQIFERL